MQHRANVELAARAKRKHISTALILASRWPAAITSCPVIGEAEVEASGPGLSLPALVIAR